jgi:hypothetical protein
LESRKLEEKCKLLEEQNKWLTDELTNAIDHSNELCEKIVLVEMSKDRLKKQLTKITLKTGYVVPQHPTPTVQSQPLTSLPL